MGTGSPIDHIDGRRAISCSYRGHTACAFFDDESQERVYIFNSIGVQKETERPAVRFASGAVSFPYYPNRGLFQLLSDLVRIGNPITS